MADPITDPLTNYGIPGGSTNVGGGYGYLPYLNQRDQLLASLYLGQGGLGKGILETLTQFLTSPTSGPLGLAATSAFGGNPQQVTEGTGGAGLNMGPYTSLFDQLLQGLSSSVMNPGSPFNPENKGQYNPSAAKIDPNNQPAPNPTNAAASPNTAQDWISSWQAFNPGKTWGKDEADPALGLVDWSQLTKQFEGLGRKMGGGVPLTGYQEGGTAPLPSRLGDSGERPKIQGPTFDAAGGDQQGMREFAALGEASKLYAAKHPNDPNAEQNFWSTLVNIQKIFQFHNQTGGTTLPPTAMQAPGMQLGDLNTWSPQLIQQLLGQTSGATPPAPSGTPVPPAASSGPVPTRLAGGGSMTIGGQPHYIVDSSGYPVAALTEDGKKERVTGVGGVEVEPLDPMRNAMYKMRQAVSDRSAGWGAMLADMRGSLHDGAVNMMPDSPALPGYAAGGTQIIGDSRVTAPTWGGTDVPREQQLLPQFQSTYDAASGQFSMPEGGNYVEKYAKLLGGAMSGTSQAVSPDALNAMAAGKLPDKLLSAFELTTLSPSQRTAYAQLLKQAGVVQSEQDLEYFIRQMTPDALS